MDPICRDERVTVSSLVFFGVAGRGGYWWGGGVLLTLRDVTCAGSAELWGVTDARKGASDPILVHPGPSQGVLGVLTHPTRSAAQQTDLRRLTTFPGEARAGVLQVSRLRLI